MYEKPTDEFFQATHSFRKLNIGSILPEKIAPGDFKTLMMIHCLNEENEKQGVKISDVAAKRDVAVPAISRTLKTLEKRNLILRTVDKNDRRNTYVELTTEGKAVLEESHTIMRDFFYAISDRMGEQKMKVLVQSLKELYEIAEDEIGNRKYKDRKEKASE